MLKILPGQGYLKTFGGVLTVQKIMLYSLKANLLKNIFVLAACLSVCALPTCLVPSEPRRGYEVPWFLVVVSHYVDAGNQIWILWKMQPVLLTTEKPL